MEARELAIPGAFAFRPKVFGDDRGLFVSPYQEEAFLAATGHRLFPVAQSSMSRSRAGVVRGVHYTLTPPGSAKYVHCASGRALDIVVDLRVGSPTFGQWDTVRLSGEEFQAVYCPVGVGHAYVSEADGTLMCYQFSCSYVPAHELAVSVLDPELGLPIPAQAQLSERDQVAPTLAQALAQGLLPDLQECQQIQAKLIG